MYRVLSVTLSGEQALAARIQPRRCTKCSAEWTQVRPLDNYPAIPRAEWPTRFDALLLETFVSRSGAHYVRVGAYAPTRYLRPHRRRLSADYTPDRRMLIPAPVELRPAVYVEQPLAVWRRDQPFSHECAAVEVEHVLDLGEPTEVAECTLCYGERLTDSPIHQGHLFLAPVQIDLHCHYTDPETSLECLRPLEEHRILPATDTALSSLALGHVAHRYPEVQTRLYSTYQPGVEDMAVTPVPANVCGLCPHGRGAHRQDNTMAGLAGRCLAEGCDYHYFEPLLPTRQWFNHAIPADGTAMLVRGQVGALIADRSITITSPDHAPLAVPAGRYDLYHPWPARAGQGNGD